MKYTRVYCFGGDHKDGDDDFVMRYVAENGKTIEVRFLISNQSFRDYVVDGNGFATLKEAKAYCENTAETEISEQMKLALFNKMLQLEHLGEMQEKGLFDHVDYIAESNGAYKMLDILGLGREYFRWSYGK